MSVKNVGWNEIRNSAKLQEYIGFQHTDDSSHVGEGSDPEKTTFFKLSTIVG